MWAYQVFLIEAIGEGRQAPPLWVAEIRHVLRTTLAAITGLLPLWLRGVQVKGVAVKHWYRRP